MIDSSQLGQMKQANSQENSASSILYSVFEKVLSNERLLKLSGVLDEDSSHSPHYQLAEEIRSHLGKTH